MGHASLARGMNTRQNFTWRHSCLGEGGGGWSSRKDSEWTGLGFLPLPVWRPVTATGATWSSVCGRGCRECRGGGPWSRRGWVDPSIRAPAAAPETLLRLLPAAVPAALLLLPRRDWSSVAARSSGAARASRRYGTSTATRRTERSTII